MLEKLLVWIKEEVNDISESKTQEFKKIVEDLNKFDTAERFIAAVYYRQKYCPSFSYHDIHSIEFTENFVKESKEIRQITIDTLREEFEINI
jgi:hypothetical protein